MSGFLQDFDLVVSDCIVVDEKDNIIRDSFFRHRNSGPGLIKNFYKNSFLGCCMAFNRNVLDKALPFPVNIPMHDIWIGSIAQMYGTTFFCEEKLLRYRRHSGNASFTSCKKSPFKLKNQMLLRMRLASELLKRRISRP